MYLKQYLLIGVACLLLMLSSFSNSKAPRENAESYYEQQLDTLLVSLNKFQKTAIAGSSKQELINSFLECRNAYKRSEFFIDLFTPYKARALNGPDLLKIEEENPSDSIKPHGLQVMETILYNEKPDRERLNNELALFVKNVNQLRNDPDRKYYFKDAQVWQGMQLGIYRIISMGITGFDVPSSYHAIPETKNVLRSVNKVAGFYKKEIGALQYAKGNELFGKAISYLDKNRDFNKLDRITFVRDYMNPISAWIAACRKKQGYINYNERSPLNPEAKSLFAADIMNMAFFAPNDKYIPTPERIALGKRLFYDAQLSGNGMRSCASCHQPEKGFTDGLTVPSDLPGSKPLLRNTPTLWNASLQTKQFYDSRTDKLENQLSAVVHNTDEMNGSLHNSIAKLLADKTYSAAFAKAYPDTPESITEYNIANAISNYVRSLISLNSKFDRYMRHETDSFTAGEKNGFNLFMGKAKCGSCHYAPVFNGLTPPLYQETESEVLAVPATDAPISVLDGDAGKFMFTRIALHKYNFKTPTVHNIALTAPYMHNGVFKTLQNVLDFYNDGGGAGRGITLATQTLPTEKLKLTKKEMKDIIAFLYTLTDTSHASYDYLKMK